MDASMKDWYAAVDEQEAHLAALTAYHEAGHVVLSLVAGVLPDKVSMVGYRPGTSASATYRVPDEGDTDEARAHQLVDEVVCLMAGMAAERLYAEQEGLYELFVDLDKVIRFGGKHDRKQAVRLVNNCTGGFSRRKVEKMLADLEVEAGKTLKRRWATVEAVAAALLKEYRLDQARLAEIIEASLSRKAHGA